MKAITAKYLGPTNFRGSRIVCKTEGNKSKTYPYQYEARHDEAFRNAAKAYAESLGWEGEWHEGGLPDGTYVYVLTNPAIRSHLQQFKPTQL